MKIVILCSTYEENTAFANRVNALIKGIVECGHEVEIVFVSRVPHISPIINYQGVIINELSTSCKNMKLGNLILLYKGRKFAKMLPKGTHLLVLGCDFLLPLVLFKHIYVSHERTEHPDVVRSYPSYWHDIYIYSLRKLASLFVISTSLKDYFKSIGVSNISIINMVADAGRFSKLIRQQGKEKYIAFCGNGSNNKDGVDILIKAFKLIANKYPDISLKIIGPAPKDYVSGSNKALVRELEIESRVVFTGIVQTEFIPQLLIDAEILALARPDSLQAKCGFPTKLGEYLLSGRPVVVTDVGDIPLFLEHKKSALIANNGDVESFASCMSWLLDHPEEAYIIGKEGQRVALNKFNYHTEAKKIVDQLNKVSL